MRCPAAAAAGLAPLAAAGLAPSPLAAAGAAALQRRANYTSMAELPMSKAWICRGDGRFVGARPGPHGRQHVHACVTVQCDLRREPRACSCSIRQRRSTCTACCTGAPCILAPGVPHGWTTLGMVRSEAAQGSLLLRGAWRGAAGSRPRIARRRGRSRGGFAPGRRRGARRA